MTATKPTDFQTFWDLIPNETKEHIWLFSLKQDRKNPDIPFGTVLKGNLAYRLSYYDALNRLKWGKNVGIYALQRGLMFVDLDVKNGKLLASQRTLDAIALNPTLTIQTRNGGIQKYYLNNGLYPNQKIKENGVPIGELRTDWYYVVSVGSYVTPDEHSMYGDGTYRLIGDCRTINKFNGFHGILQRGEVGIDETNIINKPEAKMVYIQQYNAALEQKGKRKVKRVI